MARPQSSDYDARKQRILAVAANSFATEGFHKASIGKIAKRCEISKSLIYHYYPSKEEMLYHAMLDHVKDLEACATETLELDLSPEDALKHIVKEYLAIYERTVDCHHLLVNELSSLPEDRRQEVVNIQNNVVHAFAELDQKLSPTDLDLHQAKSVVSMLMLGMINWTYIWFKADGGLSSDKLARMITDLLLNGLKGLGDNSFK
ncbi:MAG: TetR/AcrR family transcriptional regulator [Kordiimonadaceae bacterium]|nr:TetR/AcrR family transcriptional regulator [Kordiimonadaceae bacterium]